MAEPGTRDDVQRVLLVDDHADTLETLQLMFDLLGHDTRVATCGQDAVAVALTFVPHLIVLDIGLPDTSGFEVANVLRGDPRFASVYIAALSGHLGPQDEQRSQQASFDTFVAKPMALPTIKRLLYEAAAKARGPQAAFATYG